MLTVFTTSPRWVRMSGSQADDDFEHLLGKGKQLIPCLSPLNPNIRSGSESINLYFDLLNLTGSDTCRL